MSSEDSRNCYSSGIFNGYDIDNERFQSIGTNVARIITFLASLDTPRSSSKEEIVVGVSNMYSAFPSGGKELNAKTIGTLLSPMKSIGLIDSEKVKNTNVTGSGVHQYNNQYFVTSLGRRTIKKALREHSKMMLSICRSLDISVRPPRASRTYKIIY